MVLATLEAHRLELQERLDGLKEQRERNRLGQFATPPALAQDILEHAKVLLPPRQAVRFLDPAFGTGSFYSALLKTFPSSSIRGAVGYELDPHYGDHARTLWRDTALELHLADFTRASPPAPAVRPNLVICNPPYVRHHHLGQDDKLRLRAATEEVARIRLSGLAGLYCYFLALAHAWLTSDGLAGWLIPSEFLTVNYGRAVKEYLLKHVTLLQVHRFDPNDVQFGDALVSSAVVWFRNSPPPLDHVVDFTFGGSLRAPARAQQLRLAELRPEAKWTAYPTPPSGGHRAKSQAKLGDLFTIKRGIATGSNDFFVLTEAEAAEQELPEEYLTPILPSPRHLRQDVITSDPRGVPQLDQRLYLLSCPLGEEEVRTRHPALWRYLVQGKVAGIDQRYLCRHRSPWYSQERRPAAPIVCTYMGRPNGSTGRPFRFILNRSRATAANVYLLLYPKPDLSRLLQAQPALLDHVWEGLQDLTPETLLGEGRVYGGGLYKLEPKELANAPADALLRHLPTSFRTAACQGGLFAVGE